MARDPVNEIADEILRRAREDGIAEGEVTYEKALHALDNEEVKRLLGLWAQMERVDPSVALEKIKKRIRERLSS